MHSTLSHAGLVRSHVVDAVRAAQAERKIPMNYASRYRNTALSRQSYLPFKVNATGVMPVIFSSTLLSLPTGLSRYLPWLEPVAAALGPAGLLYLPVWSWPH